MIRLRSTEPGDLPALSKLYARGFGRPLAPQEWEWKYRRLPGRGRSAVAVDAEGRLLAHAGAVWLPARWPGWEGGVWQATDWVGSTTGQGLKAPMVELGRWLLDDLWRPGDASWIFGFPSARHQRLGERALGYRPLAGFTPLAGSVSKPGAAPDRPPRVRLETMEAVTGTWAAAVWEACGVPGIRRSTEFLNWRYHARPERYYRVYRLVSGLAEGLAVFAFVGEVAQAAELWLPPGEEWGGALAALAADLASSGIRRWRLWPPAPGTAAGADLRGAGLTPEGEVRAAVRCLSGEADPRRQAAGFHLAMGDWDLT